MLLLFGLQETAEIKGETKELALLSASVQPRKKLWVFVESRGRLLLQTAGSVQSSR